MHKVQRAIILAAGIGQRMRPITLETPKPLVTVNGVRMIDTVIDALHQNGIYEIYVVVGYLKSKFTVLQEKYPELVFIENPYFETCNNISSLYAAREHLSDVMILDGDQLIYNPEILRADFERSGYNAVWTETQTDEWLMEVKNEIVTSCSRTGGSKGWQLYSISRWTHEDGEKLQYYLEVEFDEKKNRQIYWDDVAMFCHPQAFTLGIFKMEKSDIIEIDNINELVAIDSSYQKLLEHSCNS